jgi:aldehyde:ferredoxin oxidoreductase
MYGLDVRDWAPEPYDSASVAGAGRDAIAFQDYVSLFNPLGLCKFVAKTIHDQIPALINTATGWGLTDDEVWRIGARVFNLKRVLNNRLGITRADDTLPERCSPRRALGPGGRTVPDLAAMLEEYYAARGWLPDGRPSPETLAALGLEGV